MFIHFAYCWAWDPGLVPGPKHMQEMRNIFENHGKNTNENILSTQFIFVHPMYQNKGIGTELMNFKSNNLDLMNKQMKGYIERVECTKSSIRFFDKLGFKFKKLSDCKKFLVLEK